MAQQIEATPVSRRQPFNGQRVNFSCKNNGPC
jgi:hypothetical protein